MLTIFQPLSVLLSCRIGYAELKVRVIGYAELTLHASTVLFNLQLEKIFRTYHKRFGFNTTRANCYVVSDEAKEYLDKSPQNSTFLIATKQDTSFLSYVQSYKKSL